MLLDEEAAKLINEEEMKLRAMTNMEQNGIVFLDELDKVTRRSEQVGGADVSREGVQRDLLPLILDLSDIIFVPFFIGPFVKTYLV